MLWTLSRWSACQPLVAKGVRPGALDFEKERKSKTVNTEERIERAQRLAEAVANHFNLDFSVESLKEVDRLLHEARGWQRETKSTLVEGLGFYVGEVLARETEGHWCIKDDFKESMGTSLVLEVPGGPGGMILSPLGRCWKRIEHGESDGVEVWARVVVGMAGMCGQGFDLVANEKEGGGNEA